MVVVCSNPTQVQGTVGQARLGLEVKARPVASCRITQFARREDVLSQR